MHLFVSLRPRRHLLLLDLIIRNVLALFAWCRKAVVMCHQAPQTKMAPGPKQILVLLTVLMSSDTSGSRDSTAFVAPNPSSTAGEDEDAVPRLPEADPDSNLPRIKLGETISFEEMGPVILNADGSTRRIANWDQMTEHEQKTTWRRISKRNEERRKRLLEEQLKQDEEGKEL